MARFAAALATGVTSPSHPESLGPLLVFGNIRPARRDGQRKLLASMDTKAARKRIRSEWEKEAREDRQQEEWIEVRVKKWKRATIYFGVAFIATCAAVVPFLAGHALYRRWDSVGKNLVLLAMALFTAFVYVCGHYYAFWNYLRSVLKTNKKFGPPNVRYKKT